MSLVSSPISDLFDSATGGGLSIRLSNTSVLEHSANNTVLGHFSVSSAGSWTYNLVAGHDSGGQVALSGANLVATSTPFDYPTATSAVIRIHAVRTSPYTELVQEFTLHIQPVLVDLAFDATAFVDNLAAGSTIANISNLRAGSTVTVAPANGKVAYSSSKLVVGLVPSVPGTITYSVTESLAGNTHTTNVAITATAPGSYVQGTIDMSKAVASGLNNSVGWM